MSVKCGVCEGPLQPGAQFSLQGQYVVHRHCAGNMPRTEVLLRDVRKQLADLDYAVKYERDQNRRVLEDLRDDLRKARLDRTIAEANEASNGRAREDWASIAAARALEIVELQRETTRLRNNLPVASSPSTPTAQAPQGAATEQIPDRSTAVVDDTAARFALLELD